MVFKFLVSITRDQQLAEELTQETFYQAVKSADRYDATSTLSTWLCQIAKHLWLQELDRRRRKGLPVQLEESLTATDDTPIEHLVSADEKIAVFKVIHQLNEVSKEVVLLRLNGEFSFKAIGEIFGKSENWARVTYYRAKQKITKGMNDNEST